MPLTVECVGPIVDRAADGKWKQPRLRDGAHLLAVVSFSTDQSQCSRIQRTLARLAGKSYRVLITTWASDVAGIERPENAITIRYVPRFDILTAAIAVSHGGHRTLTAALANEVPLACLPSPLIAD